MTRNRKTRNTSKTPQRGKSNKSNRVTSNSVRDMKSNEDPSNASNNPEWYAANEAILRDAASYPFSYCTGASETHDSAVWSAISRVNSAPESQVPGIATFRVYPTIGTSAYATDPINVAAQSVYSFVRHANSGHSNYDPADLMLYILAMANMYSFLTWAQRLYGYALTYDQRNRYIPKDLIRTNNVDADDLIKNLANFRFWINTLIAKMVSFAVPATMSVFSRMSFLYSDYFIEGTSIKEQLYQYVPEGFYKFGIDSDSLGNLTWEPFDYTTLMSVQDIETYGDALFNAIWSQEDFGIMSGDVLKAYGNNIIKLTELPEYYNIAPKFDAMVLTQMKNADLVRVTPIRISQDPNDGTILQIVIPAGYTTSDVFYGTTTSLGNEGSTGANAGMNGAIKDYNVLTVDTDDPDPRVVIEATRLKVAYDQAKAWYKCGTELITKVVLTKEPGTDYEVLPHMIIKYNDVNTIDCVEAAQRTLEVARNFHYMPKIWAFFINWNVSPYKLDVMCHFDIDNFTVLTYEDIRKLHEAATINMFAVPSIGKV